MKNRMKRMVVVATCGVILGCTVPTMYYWGGYSSSLYTYKKTPNEKTLADHKKTLEDILDKSPKYRLRVPPGVYCEYGYILAKEGNNTEAEKYFELEKTTYPESAYFIDKMKSQTSTKIDATSIPDTTSAKQE